MEWAEFKRLFKKQYLSENYYERKTKEFYELRLGSMNMEELINKFLDLLRFVPYIKEERVKVQRFLSCLPQAYKDRIEFDNPKTLDEALRKADCAMSSTKMRNDSFRTWKDRKPERFSQQKRGSRPSPHKNTQRNTPGGPYTKSGPPLPKYAKPASLGVKGTEGTPKGPLTCWECDGPHLKRFCPRLTGASNTLHSIHEASTVGDIGRSYHCINAALEDRQADHQSTIVEIEGIVFNHIVSVLIDPGATLSYISPRTVELCHLDREKHVRPWWVQLATGARRKVTDFVTNCEIQLQDHKTKIKLNILPLVSYDMIIGMDWLEKNKVVLNCYENTFTYIAKDQVLRTVRGFPKPVSVRQISAIQLKKCLRKGYKLFVVRVADLLLNKNQTSLKQHPVLE